MPRCNVISTGVTHLLGPADDKPLQQPGLGLILCMFLAIMIALLTSRSALGTGGIPQPPRLNLCSIRS